MVANVDEQRMSLAQTAKRAGVQVSTVWRWVLKGVAVGRDTDGRAVRREKLAAGRVGGRRCVTEAEFARFMSAINSTAA